MRSRVRTSAVLTVMLVAALVPISGAGAQVEAQQYEEHTVDTVDNAFIPDDIVVTVGDTVNWVAPAENEEQHTMHEDDNAIFEGLVNPGQTFSHRFTSTGVYTYHCDVHPTEMSGSVTVQGLDTPNPPEAPRNVTAEAGDGSATVVWSAPEFDGGSPITGYTVTVSPGGATETVTGTSATITGLDNGTSYTFDVAATNEVGTGPAAASNAVTPSADDTDPDPAPDPEGPCGPDVPAAPFTDRDAIPVAHRVNVDCASSRGIISGFPDNTYRPTLSVRRDQMASFIARSLDAAGFELPAPRAERFTDVAPGSAHDEAIHRLAAADIVQGGAGGQAATTYGTSQGVRRDQMASFLLRAAAFAADQDLGSQTQAFADVGAGNPHFSNVNGAAQIGLASGFPDGTYRPGAGVRRDQMGTFVTRLLGYLAG